MQKHGLVDVTDVVNIDHLETVPFFVSHRVDRRSTGKKTLTVFHAGKQTRYCSFTIANLRFRPREGLAVTVPSRGGNGHAGIDACARASFRSDLDRTAHQR